MRRPIQLSKYLKYLNFMISLHLLIVRFDLPVLQCHRWAGPGKLELRVFYFILSKSYLSFCFKIPSFILIIAQCLLFIYFSIGT